MAGFLCVHRMYEFPHIFNPFFLLTFPTPVTLQKPFIFITFILFLYPCLLLEKIWPIHGVMLILFCRKRWRLWHSASLGYSGLGTDGTSEWPVGGLAVRFQCYQELHASLPHLSCFRLPRHFHLIHDHQGLAYWCFFGPLVYFPQA